MNSLTPQLSALFTRARTFMWARRYFLCVSIFLGSLLPVLTHYFAFNFTASMQAKLVWLDHGAAVKRGDLVVYRFNGAGIAGRPSLRGSLFFKRVIAGSGDLITEQYGNLMVGQRQLRPMRMASNGTLVTPTPTGTIPQGMWFMAGDAEDSFDSRYVESGLVATEAIIAVAHELFPRFLPKRGGA